MSEIFQPPGPGTWMLDDTHFVGAMTGFLSALFPASFMRGWAEGFARYGAIVERIDAEVVGGRMYARIKPVGAPEAKAGAVPKLPPKALMRLLCKVHPELRRRNKRAADVIASKRWRDDRTRWRTELGPRLHQRLLDLQSSDPQALSDAELRTHLAALVAFFDESNAQHFRQNPAGVFPVGDFVARVAEWTGVGLPEAVACLQGSNPSSAATLAPIDLIAEAVRQSGESLAALRSDGDAAKVLAKLRESSREVRDALDAYLCEHGNRLVTGFDVSDQTMAELPGTILQTISVRLEADDTREPHAGADAPARKLRERVPAVLRSEFDEALIEARAAYGLHDEDVGICYLWPLGLMRRDLLEIGRRSNLESILEATPDEVDALLAGAGAPTRAELDGRAAERERLSKLDPPKMLGPEAPMPSPEMFPGALGRMMRGILTYVTDANFARESTETSDLRGVGASRGVYEGRARIVCSPDEFDLIEAGDVLIAPTTSPAYNVVLPLIGAVVTDRGGALSHAAIVAREFGIPAVVGTVNATTAIPDGAKVRVDGTTGLVEVL